MRDENKTKGQLINELKEMRRKMLEIAKVASESERARELLLGSEARNRAMLEAMPDMMFRVSKDGTYLDFKPGRGVEPYVLPAKFLGKRVSEVMPPEVAAQTMAYLKWALQSGGVETFELQLLMNAEIPGSKFSPLDNLKIR